MNVDVHAHIVDREYLDDLVSTLGLETESTCDGKRLFRRNGSTVAWSRGDMFEIDRRLREMDEKNIAIRILSLSAPNVYLWDDAHQLEAARHINDALGKLCRQHPDRFVGLASLPLKDIEGSLVELDRCINEIGMKGVIIGSNIDGLQLDDPKFDAWVKGRTPSGRWGRPEDLIGVTVFLASAASDYVNGQIVYVDGGLLAVI